MCAGAGGDTGIDQRTGEDSPSRHLRSILGGAVDDAVEGPSRWWAQWRKRQRSRCSFPKCADPCAGIKLATFFLTSPSARELMAQKDTGGHYMLSLTLCFCCVACNPDFIVGYKVGTPWHAQGCCFNLALSIQSRTCKFRQRKCKRKAERDNKLRWASAAFTPSRLLLPIPS